MKNSLWRFKDVVLDLDRVVAVTDDCVLTEGGHWLSVGDEAADALRKAIPVFPELPQDTCGTGRTTRPACSTESESGEVAARLSSVRPQLQRPSSPITSFPGKVPHAGKKPCPKGRSKATGKAAGGTPAPPAGAGHESEEAAVGSE